MFDRLKLILLWIAAFGSLFSAAILWSAVRAGIWILCASLVSGIKVASAFAPHFPSRDAEASNRA